MGFLFNTFIYQPLYNLLVLVYNLVPFHDFGIAIIIVTILIKLLLIPLSRKQIESQKKMQVLQPKIKEIQQKYKNDKEKQSKAMMELYKTQKANPLSGCLPLIFQLIFLIALWRVFFNISNAGLQVDPKSLYSFVSNPGQINQYFLGIVELSKSVDIKNITVLAIPHLVLVVLSAGAQYYQMKMMMAKQKKNDKPKEKAAASDMAQMMNSQMLYLMPLLTLFIGVKFPAGLVLYWLVSTVFMIVQQYLLEKKQEESKITAQK